MEKNKRVKSTMMVVFLGIIFISVWLATGYLTRTISADDNATPSKAVDTLPATKVIAETNKFSLLPDAKTFGDMVNKKEISEVVISEGNLYVKTVKGQFLKGNQNVLKDVREYLLLNNVPVTVLGVEQTPVVTNSKPSFFISVIYFIVIFYILSFLLKVIRKHFAKENGREGGGNSTNNPQSLVPSQQRETAPPNLTMDDLQGQPELKKELRLLAGYVAQPQKYQKIGARMPKGVILYGPPGTGKTLAAKVVASTAGVPFLSVSGSDFMEMYVGVGAKRVRELFVEARKKAPCIIFIDEIDAIGGQRGTSNNSEKDQTINALLTELDGFKGSEGILVMVATNRLDILDPALVRPGRFDKHIAVPLPDKEGRLGILKLHAKNKRFDKSVDFEELSASTSGFSGADLESLLNESVLIAANDNRTRATKEDVDRSFFKLVMKGDRKENQSSRDKEELELVAYHEAGHALAIKLLTKDSVPKVTILSSTSGAGGVTFRNPSENSLPSKSYMRCLVQTMYAGRAAEYVLLGNEELITTGASSDIKQATRVIKQYIEAYGMGNLGMIDLSQFQNEAMANNNIIKEASKMATSLYKEVIDLLEDNRAVLVAIAKNLLAKETLGEAELDAIISGDFSLLTIKKVVVEPEVAEKEDIDGNLNATA